MSKNFGDILDAVARVVPPDSPALIHGDRVVTWADFDRRSNNLARSLHERGAKTGDKVAFYMRNCPAYMETLSACFKGRLTHVNVNYRYQATELEYIIDNSDAQVVVYAADFRDQIQLIRPKLTKVQTWIEVGSESAPDFAEGYETLAETGDGAPLDIERSPDDMLFLYTGGTTGMPKGVMWPFQALRNTQLEAARSLTGSAPETLEEHLAAVKELGIHNRQIPACPLMHGTGLFTAIGVMIGGGTVITLENSGGLDPIAIWEAVDRHGVTALAIVGDAFAKPMLQALEDNPGKFNLSTVLSITSSGVMWSTEVKRGLVKHMPQVMLLDSFGASEAVGFGLSVTTKDGETQTSKFTIGEHCRVFTEDEREVKPGSSEPGFIARKGSIPLGYYRDEAKTASIFRTINGVRYSIPGDWCTVEEDGSITLLGRGSVCINTAGEKVYPEEIEEVLKEYPGVSDALVVGLPDDKWGQAVTAVIAPEPGGSLEEPALRDHVRQSLAAYKVPKRVLFKPDLGRAANGKPDYKAIADYAVGAIAAGA